MEKFGELDCPRWLLGKVLSAGANWIVYAGSRGEQTVGVKIFFPGSIEKDDLEEEAHRLELQLQLKNGRKHLKLVEVYGGGNDVDLNTLFLIMELVSGKSHDKVINDIPRLLPANSMGTYKPICLYPL